jgi:hypothetical protein
LVTPERVTLDNGYVHAELSLTNPSLDVVRADTSGKGDHGANLLAPVDAAATCRGFVLEREDPGTGATHFSCTAPSDRLSVTVTRDDGRVGTVRIGPIVDDAHDPLVTSIWTLSLAADSRALHFDTTVEVLRAATVASIRLGAYLTTPSVHGLFERGVVQTMGAPARRFASTDRLHRFYALGGGAIDIESRGANEHVLFTGDGSYRGGLQEVLAGAFADHDAWTTRAWSAAKPTHVSAGDAWSTSATIAPNSEDFPIGTVPLDARLEGADLRAFHTALWATSVANLVSYEQPGHTAVTVGFPERGYWPGTNFYDPDAWMTVSTLVYSGDPYLQREARKLIESSGDRMLPSGQIPHHFDAGQATYVAISGATQTGPNIFWISAALQYAKSSGDYSWLANQRPKIEQALKFLTDRLDAKVKLVNAPGPLWIDVFIRTGFATDTNAFMVRLLRDVAEAESFLGRLDVAEDQRRMAREIAEAMNQHLWAEDHFVTAMDVDGNKRDFVDYDSNLLAVAFGIPSPERATKILARVDRGKCAHARPTFVSEKRYEKADCYLENTGDSDITMERIGWADGHARRAVGDLASFEKAILAPITQDLVAHTWLTERYDCAGKPTRQRGYHGYPEMVVMLLREVAYGINLGLSEVSIVPFGRSKFHYHVGNVDVSHDPERVTLRIPGSGEKRFTVGGLAPGAAYAVSVAGAKPDVRTADAGGLLRFTASYGANDDIQIVRAE